MSETLPALPLRLTQAQVLLLYPPVRCFQAYDHRHRADRQASHRLTPNQRAATGEFYYQHPLVPNRAFPSAKVAKAEGWHHYQELERAEWEKILGGAMPAHPLNQG